MRHTLGTLILGAFLCGSASASTPSAPVKAHIMGMGIGAFSSIPTLVDSWIHKGPDATMTVSGPVTLVDLIAPKTAGLPPYAPWIAKLRANGQTIFVNASAVWASCLGGQLSKGPRKPVGPCT